MSEILDLRINEIRQEGHNAITLILEEVNRKPVSYLPGQFLTLLVNIGPRELRRSYSLCSSPEIDPFLAITIKRVENGEVSRHLIDHLKEGDVLKALPPAGRFTLDINPSKQRDIFLIGAGSGTTPLFSLLKSILFKENLSKVTLIVSHHDEKSSLYQKDIQALEVKFYGRFKLITLYSEPLDHAHPRVRLNIDLLEKIVNSNLSFEKETAQFFICGPFEYMRMVRMTLIYMGFEESQIHRENFISKTFNSENFPSFPTRIINLIYKGENIPIEVPSGKTILKAALENGLPIAYSCQAGICSTCVGVCKGGKVHMSNNQVLTDNEVKAGLILTCVSYPTTDGVVIEV